MLKKIAKVFFLLFFATSVFLRLFGILQPDSEKRSYFAIKKLGNSTIQKDDIKSALIFAEKEIKLVKIFKLPIGYINSKCIDADGKLFSCNIKNLIQVEGNYTKWPIYYKKLQKYGLENSVYYAKIQDFKLDLWVFPGVLVQLPEEDSIETLSEFKNAYPDFFQKENLIDLRNTKRIGISTLKKK